MKRHYAKLLIAALTSTLLLGPTAAAQEDIGWIEGPSTGKLGSLAEIRVPYGYIFADGDDTRRLMESMQNTISNQEVGFIGPDSLDWFVVFEFDPIGYVADDEKGSLDADAILESIRQGTEIDNQERIKKGWPTLQILGWEQKPRYNESTNNLEWSTRIESEGFMIINHNTRLLGRGGVMRVTLVADYEDLGESLPLYQDLLTDYSFKAGHQYAEYQEGDKLSEYGLTALVVGGAAAVAAKTGLFKWLWKALALAFAAIIGFFKKLFRKKKS